MAALYWLAFGDIHNNIGPLESLPGLREAAGVIVTGDLTFVGGVRDAARVYKAIAGHNPNIFAQVGNMDKPEVTPWLEGKGAGMHARARALTPGLALIGLGASPPTPFDTPSEYPESELAAWLEGALAEAGQYSRLILAAHAPPYDTVCDVLPNGAHVGSTAVRAFIEKVQPALCLCGHIHEARGQCRIGNTQVINPGAFGSGGYVKISYDGKELAAELLKI